MDVGINRNCLPGKFYVSIPNIYEKFNACVTTSDVEELCSADPAMKNIFDPSHIDSLSAISIAAAEGKELLIDFLIHKLGKLGEEILNTRSKEEGLTPLSLLCKGVMEALNVKIEQNKLYAGARKLISLGANPNVCDFAEHTALDQAFRCNYISDCRGEKIDHLMLALLLRAAGKSQFFENFQGSRAVNSALVEAKKFNKTFDKYLLLTPFLGNFEKDKLSAPFNMAFQTNNFATSFWTYFSHFLSLMNQG